MAVVDELRAGPFDDQVRLPVLLGRFSALAFFSGVALFSSHTLWLKGLASTSFRDDAFLLDTLAESAEHAFKALTVSVSDFYQMGFRLLWVRVSITTIPSFAKLRKDTMLSLCDADMRLSAVVGHDSDCVIKASDCLLPT